MLPADVESNLSTLETYVDKFPNRHAQEALVNLRTALEKLSIFGGEVKWGQPSDIKARAWVIWYDDPDRGNAVFQLGNDEENEAAAREQFNRSWPSWNCYLFAAMPMEPEDPSVNERVKAVAANAPKAMAQRLRRPFAELDPDDDGNSD